MAVDTTFIRLLDGSKAYLHAIIDNFSLVAYSFCSGQNLNNIDLLMHLGYDFHSAVERLEVWNC